LQRGWRSDLSDYITTARKGVEGDIEKICSRHYYDFVSAVQDLLSIRSSSAELMELVGAVNHEFGTAGQELLQVMSDLEAKRRQGESNARALEIVQHCREVSRVLARADEHMSNYNYYAAISCVDKLRTDLHNPLTQPIAQQLKMKLPKLSSGLIAASRKDLAPWFTKFKEDNKLIGSTVLRRYASLVLRNQQIAKGGGAAASAAFMNDRKLSFVDIQEPSSISVYSIQSKGKSFSTDKWVPLGSMNSQAVPRDFFEPPLEEGVQTLEDLTASLAPLHRALHICSQLYALDSLTELYRDNREPIIKQYLFNSNIDQLVRNNGFENILPDVLAKICGFFTVEVIVRQQCADYAGGYFSATDLKTLWKATCADIGVLCRKYVPMMSDPSSILQVKEELLLITETMNDTSLGFSAGFSGSMLDIANDLWPDFERTQLEYVRKEWLSALMKTAYQPLLVDSEEVFRTQVKIFGLADIQLSASGQSGGGGGMGGAAANLDALEESERHSFMVEPNPFKAYDDFSDDESDGSDFGDALQKEFIPHNLPFSAAVPAGMTQLHLCIARYFVFAAYCPQLSRKGTDMCESVKNILVMMGDELVKDLVKDGADTPLSKACQISIDAATLSHAVGTLGGVLAETMSLSQWSDAAEATLDSALEAAKQKLHGVASKSHDFIFELLCTKVEDLMSSLCFVNWEPSSLPVQAHEEVNQIIDYLRVTFMWLTHLPQSVREAAHFTCCSRISSCLIEYIMSPKVAHLNVISIAALDMDVVSLEAFADSCGVAQLRQCFGELKELVKALLHPHLVDFADKQLELRKSLFPRLANSKLAAVLEK
ncbi:unnamed protein product, partial [Ectocarpus fasciculatus]